MSIEGARFCREIFDLSKKQLSFNVRAPDGIHWTKVRKQGSSQMSAFYRFASALMFVSSVVVSQNSSFAGNHEANFNPANPRPDFLPHTFYNNWVSYRAQYNRPHPIGGHIAAIIEPTSQEAMAWRIHQANGDYACKRPGYVPLYYYPKPWEALPTMARPNAPLFP